MDPVSAVVAALGFVGQGVQTAKTVNDLISRYRSAHEQLDEISETVESTTAALQVVGEILKEEQHADFPTYLQKSHEWYSLVNKQLSRCNTLLQEIEKALKSLLKDDVVSTGAKLKWSIYKKDAVFDVLGRLRDVKIELNQSVTASSLQREVRQLRINSSISKAALKNQSQIEELEKSLHEDRINSLKKQLKLEELEKQKNLSILRTRRKMNSNLNKPTGLNQNAQRSRSPSRSGSSAANSELSRRQSAQENDSMYAASIVGARAENNKNLPVSAAPQDPDRPKTIEVDDGTVLPQTNSHTPTLENQPVVSSVTNLKPPTATASPETPPESSKRDQVATDQTPEMVADAESEKALDDQPSLEQKVPMAGQANAGSKIAIESTSALQASKKPLANNANNSLGLEQSGDVEKPVEEIRKEALHGDLYQTKFPEGNQQGQADDDVVQAQGGPTTGQTKTVRWRERLHQIGKKARRHTGSPKHDDGSSNQNFIMPEKPRNDTGSLSYNSYYSYSTSEISKRHTSESERERQEVKREDGTPQHRQPHSNGKVEDWLARTPPSRLRKRQTDPAHRSRYTGNAETVKTSKHLPIPTTGGKTQPKGRVQSVNEDGQAEKLRARLQSTLDKESQQKAPQPRPRPYYPVYPAHQVTDSTHHGHQSNFVAQAQGEVVDLNLARIPQDPTRSFSYLESWMFRQAHPVPGVPDLSWSRCIRSRLPMSFEELSSIVRNYLATGKQFWDDFLVLSWYQRQQLSHLLDIKNESESDPAFEWHVAAITTEPLHATKFEISTIHVVLQRRPRIGGTMPAPRSPTPHDENEYPAKAPPTGPPQPSSRDSQPGMQAYMQYPPPPKNPDVYGNITGAPQTQYANIALQRTKPIWIKIHRKHVDPETLNVFGLPWEVSAPDTEYVIIKKYISPDVQNEIFEHTKRLRQHKETQNLQIIDKKKETPVELRKRSDHKKESRIIVNKDQMYMVRPKQRYGGTHKSVRRSGARRASDSIEEVNRQNFSDQSDQQATQANWLSRMLLQPIFMMGGGGKSSTRAGHYAPSQSAMPRRSEFKDDDSAGDDILEVIEEHSPPASQRGAREDVVTMAYQEVPRERDVYRPRETRMIINERRDRTREPERDAHQEGQRLEFNPIVERVIKSPLPPPDPLLTEVLSKWGNPDEGGDDNMSIETKSELNAEEKPTNP